MDLKEALLEGVKQNVNVPGLFNHMLDNALEPALKSAIEKSETKIDDIVYAALYPVLESELKKIIAEQWKELLTPSADDIVKEEKEILGEMV